MGSDISGDTFFSEYLSPDWLKIIWMIKIARSSSQKTRPFFLCGIRREIWKADFISACESAFLSILGFYFTCSFSWKSGVQVKVWINPFAPGQCHENVKRCAHRSYLSAKTNSCVCLVSVDWHPKHPTSHTSNQHPTHALSHTYNIPHIRSSAGDSLFRVLAFPLSRSRRVDRLSTEALLPEAQNRYWARSLEGGTSRWCGNKELGEAGTAKSWERQIVVRVFRWVEMQQV